MSNLVLGVGQAHQLESAFRRGNWTNAEINELPQGNLLEQIRMVLHGDAFIKFRPRAIPKNHIIDCDADTKFAVNETLFVVEHQKGGQFVWDAKKMEPFLFKNERDVKKGPDIFALYQKLRGKAMPNANVLAYLLELDHLHLIPEDWQDKVLLFGGTVYKSLYEDNSLYLLGLTYHPVFGWKYTPHFVADDSKGDGLAKLHAL
jgi:hypothetical protein